MDALTVTPGVPNVDGRVAELEHEVCDLREALEQRERQIDAIRRISEALFSQTSTDALIRETLTVAIEVLRADAGSLLLHDPIPDTLVFRYVIGPAADTLIGFVMPASQGIAGRVFRSGEADLTQKVSERQEFNREVDEKTGYTTESMMTVPVKRPDGESIGVMQILNARSLFDRRDLEVLQVLCSQAAESIENARLLHQARRAEIVNIIGDISHDIKNMLTPIQTGVWTLEPMLADLFESLDAICITCPEADAWGNRIAVVLGEVRDDYGWILANALDAAEKVQARTREIADAVKGEMAPPLFEPANLNETAQEVVRSLRLVAENAGLKLLLELDDDLPLVQFDRKQMYNALYNLVNNAVPETPDGGSISIRTRSPSADEEQIIMEVADTGRGMPPHVRARLFTDEAVSTKPGGTGLGTRIVAGVVKRHNGTITVSSEDQKGTTFTVRLPLRQTAEE